MILGESQILWQVRDALTAASEAHSIEVPLVGLFTPPSAPDEGCGRRPR